MHLENTISPVQKKVVLFLDNSYVTRVATGFAVEI